MRYTIICDDFGLDPSTNQAILELLSAGQAHGTSVLITKRQDYRDDFQALKLLKKERPQLKVGLHFNLTEAPLSSEEIASQVVFKLFFRTLFGVPRPLKEELSHQINSFIDFFDILDHIDGHQHIQYFPQVYEEIMHLLKKQKLESTKVRHYPFLSESGNLKAQLMSFFAFNHGHVGKLIDLHDIIKNRVSLDYLNHDNTEIMAHVAHPNISDKSLDFGSFSFENRVKQFFYLKNQP